jgi:hypothetical protein
LEREDGRGLQYRYAVSDDRARRRAAGGEAGGRCGTAWFV